MTLSLNCDLNCVGRILVLMLDLFVRFLVSGCSLEEAADAVEAAAAELVASALADLEEEAAELAASALVGLEEAAAGPAASALVDSEEVEVEFVQKWGSEASKGAAASFWSWLMAVEPERLEYWFLDLFAVRHSATGLKIGEPQTSTSLDLKDCLLQILSWYSSGGNC
jgi:hypothetical protein